MIPAHLWRQVDRDPAPKAKRGPIPKTGHYRVGDGPVRRSLSAAVRDVLRSGGKVEVLRDGVWTLWSREADRA